MVKLLMWPSPMYVEPSQAMSVMELSFDADLNISATPIPPGDFTSVFPPTLDTPNENSGLLVVTQYRPKIIGRQFWFGRVRHSYSVAVLKTCSTNRHAVVCNSQVWRPLDTGTGWVMSPSIPRSITCQSPRLKTASRPTTHLLAGLAGASITRPA